MNIIHLDNSLLEKWVSKYTGLTFKKDRHYINGRWQELRGLDRIVSEAMRYSVGKAFFDALPEYGFAACPPNKLGHIHVYRTQSPSRACWAAPDDRGQLCLDLVTIAEFSQDRTEVMFTPHVFSIHRIGDQDAEQGRSIYIDRLFPVLKRHGKLLGRTLPVKICGKEVQSVSLKTMGHNVQLLTSLFERFTGGNPSFDVFASEFTPTPVEDTFVEMAEGVEEQILREWKDQLDSFKRKLVPAI